MESICPGARRLIQPQIVFRTCPNCGGEVEFFEYEVEQVCPRCGKAVKKKWKPHAYFGVNTLRNAWRTSKPEA